MFFVCLKRYTESFLKSVSLPVIIILIKEIILLYLKIYKFLLQLISIYSSFRGTELKLLNIKHIFFVLIS